ncbi:hypothetical protein PJE062_1882 [Pseudovibrio sp. JE062]|nr:hypothetical protein PJE062_1882 [Pseudovibrio sp. JE062]
MHQTTLHLLQNNITTQKNAVQRKTTQTNANDRPYIKEVVSETG